MQGTSSQPHTHKLTIINHTTENEIKYYREDIRLLMTCLLPPHKVVLFIAAEQFWRDARTHPTNELGLSQNQIQLSPFITSTKQ